MSREHRRTPAQRHEPQQSRLVKAARRGARSAGEPISDSVRRPLESQFGHDFRDVRIHHDTEAARAAQELAARAYTVGQEVVFAEGSYAPETGEGARVLAHELTHVVQRSERTMSPDLESGLVIDEGDPSELAAQRATETITAGDAVSTESVGTLADSVGPAGGAVVQRWGLGDLWDDAKDVGSSVVSGVDKGVNWAEDQTSAGMNAMVHATSGIPVVSQLAQGAAWAENGMVDMTGGAIKGAGDVASGLGGAIAHPLDAAAGVEGMLEHGPNAIPFLGTTLKGIHGAYDLLAHDGGRYGNSWGDLAHHLNPLQQSEDDTNYMGAVGKGIVAPGDEKEGGGWQRWRDNPIEATSRAATNIAPVLAGAGAGGPIAAGDAAAAAADTAGATSAAADAADAANAADASAAVKPAAAAGTETVQELIDDAVRNAERLSEGSKPLTTEGTGRNARVVEAQDPAPGPAGGGGAAPPATPAAPAAAPVPSGQGALSRAGGEVKGRVASGQSSTPSPAPGAGSVQDVAAQYIKHLQGTGQAGTDAELSAPKAVGTADQAYGNRPVKPVDPDSLYSRRRGR